MTAKSIVIPWPAKGINENWAYSNQPDQTCINAQNVRSYEFAAGRNRGGSRGGISKLLSTRVNGALPGQDLTSVVYTGASVTYDELDTPLIDWTANPGAGVDMNCVAVDTIGNVYVAGARDAAGSKAIWVYTKNGTLLYSRDLAASSVIRGIAVQPGSSTPKVVVVGNDIDDGTGGVAHVHVYDYTLATEQWQYLIVAPNNTGDIYAVAMDSDGAVYICGDHMGAGATEPDRNNAWRLTSAGVLNGSINTGGGIMKGIAVSQALQVYICGQRGGGSYSAWHYDDDFSTLTSRFDTTDSLNAVAVDQLGNVVFTGAQVGSVNTWKRDGTNIATSTWTANTSASGLGVCIDKNNKVYVCDGSTTTNVWKFSSAGATEWTGGFTGGGTQRNGIAVSGSLDVVIAGVYSAATDPLVSLTTVDESVHQTTPRTIQHLALSGGVLKRLDLVNSVFVDIANGSGNLLSGGRIYSTSAFQKVYYADGRNYRVYDPLLFSLDPWITTAGDLPDDADNTGVTENDRGATLIELWRGRVLLSGVVGDEQNIFASAVANPLDYDYNPATPTVTQAWSLNTSNAGRIGDVVRAMVPYSDDLLIVLCDSSIWRVTGDPADDGRVDLVSSITGGARGRAWCMDPAGFVYFMGGLGGFYRIAPGGIPEDMVVEELSTRFRNINTATNNIELAWNDREKGVNVFITPHVAATTKHYFWDSRNDAWWADRFTESLTTFDPTCIYESDGDDPDDRIVMLYGRDGYIRFFDDAATTDDGTAFRSYVIMGPIGSGKEPMEVKATNWVAVLGESSGGVNLDVFASDTVETAATNADNFGSNLYVFTTALVAGRNTTIHERVRGAAILVRLRNITAPDWQFESLRADVMPAGRTRQR